MKSLKIFSCVLVWGVSLAWASRPLEPQDNPSLKQWGASLKKGAEITALFKESLQDPKMNLAQKLAPLQKANEKEQAKLRTWIDQSARFIRGEIEQEAVLNHLLERLQLSLLKIRSWQQEGTRKSLEKSRQEAKLWFDLAADLAYNESSLLGIKTAGVIRSLLLDEVERDSGAPTRTRSDVKWLNEIRSPWPVDRMLLSESKRILPVSQQAVAEKVAQKIQKDPYLTVEKALRQIQGTKGQDFSILIPLWREQEIQAMKAEVNRLQRLRFLWALQVFTAEKGHRPLKAEELVSAGLLSSIPVDYETGRPLQLPQTDKVPAEGKSP